MAAEMLSAYYDKSCNSDSLFQSLEISKDETYKKHLNQYNVITLNIQQFLRKAGSPENLVNYIEDKVLTDLKQEYSDKILATEDSLPDALTTIYAQDTTSNKGFIFIIDEWDCIFREAKDNTIAHRFYLDFLKDLFKDRTYVKLAYMTGILPIKKYGTHSALNIFDEFSMTSPGYLAKYVGFTETEVKTLCEAYQMSFAEAKKWYDGYHFMHEEHIYNPKSIVDAMTERMYKSFWTSTETYEALQIYIDLNQDGLREAIISMLAKNTCVIDAEAFQNDMTSFRSKDDILTLLVHLGYLGFDEKTSSVFIPNEEVKNEFIRALRNGKHKEVAKLIQNSDLLLEQTLNMDEEAVAIAIEEAHNAGTAPLFYNNEQALRSVIRFAYISCVDEFLKIEELASGRGYADLVYFPKKASSMPVILIELKWNQTKESAINQIKEKNYPQVLEDYGGEILLVGINYDAKSQKHSCKIEKYVK
jgi:hypothetical protein